MVCWIALGADGVDRRTTGEVRATLGLPVSAGTGVVTDGRGRYWMAVLRRPVFAAAATKQLSCNPAQSGSGTTLSAASSVGSLL